MWALVLDNIVADVTTIDPNNRFHPSLNWISAPSNVEPGWTYENEQFIPPSDEPWEKLKKSYRPDILVESMPFNNLIDGSGRFAAYSVTPGEPPYVMADSFKVPSFFSPVNGAVITEAGKFIYNNNNFGGSRGPLTQPVLDLLQAVGRLGSTENSVRYGVEFYIANIAAGNGSVWPFEFGGKTYQLMTINNSMHNTSTAGYYTFTAWIRVKKGALLIQKRVQLYVDGENQSTHAVLPASSEWKLVEVVGHSSVGYDNGFPSLFAESSATNIEIAMPALFSGVVRPGRYPSPLLSTVPY